MNAVEMRGIVKQYPLVRAIDGADFTVEQGEIHSLLGENGAGKSTLMKILYGMTTPTAGEVRVFGKPVAITRPAQAIALGIGMVHQHFMLTPVMTVAENVVIGSEPVRGVFFDRKKAEAQVAAMIDEYNFHISATAKVETLSVGEQQRVEILKALYRGADLLILDEPTAVLTPQEVEDLFRVMRQLKAAGKSIIIITHKLKETMEIADRVSVLRQGKMIESGVPVAGTTMNELAQMMVGRDVELSVTRRAEQVGEENFSVRGLSLTERGVPILRDVCLSLRKGEILGIAGIEGNGQTELIEVLTGLRRPDHMELFKDGKPLSGNAAAFLAAGVGHVPEDRMTRGLVLEMSIEDNLILGYHRRPAFARRGLRLASAIRRFAEQERTEFAIKAPNLQERCSALSGGNQQKVVIARVFSENPDVIIVAQPTRGVDVGAMEYIHHRLLDLRDGGKSILLISADLDEVRSLSDRLAVIYGGRIVAEGKPDTWSDMEIGLLMTGGSLAPEKEGTA
ncbi:nucleoside ABC transporter ATP-binding protein [Flavonifractor plautii DSM 6740]|nr:nucleoside ABC transporter ATP-binding protein [Flavonifractor plautii DSM 6740]